MNCLEVQKQLDQLLDVTVDDATVTEFLNHIETCESCQDDAKSYFTLMTIVRQLDNDMGKAGLIDYDKAYDNRIRLIRDHVIRNKLRKWNKRIAFCILIVVLAVILW
ncbi:MAG: hypothetical protein K6G65_10625 [Lachnospiraceae bacterium]|nr:hypothetical protein [Lachnospiraceae bacterium]